MDTNGLCAKTNKLECQQNKTGCRANMAHTPLYCTICLVSETACIIMRHIAVMTHSLWDTWQSQHLHQYETRSNHDTSISMRHVAVMTLGDQETNPNVCALLGVTTKCKTKSHSVCTSHNLLCKQLVSKPNRQHETKHKANFKKIHRVDHFAHSLYSMILTPTTTKLTQNEKDTLFMECPIDTQDSQTSWRRF